jgi:protein SCO1/2
MKALAWWALPAAALMVAAGTAAAGPDPEPPAPPPPDVRIEQRLGEKVPQELTFRDDEGRVVRLGQYFGDKPVVLVLAYYGCPRLCNEVLNDLVKGLGGVPFTAGKDFQVVIVSFDTREGGKPKLVADKKRAYAEAYGRPDSEAGWHFLTGEQPEIDALKAAVGFKTVYDPKRDEFAHDSAVMVLSPDGKVSRYLFGLGYSPRDLRLALVESSQGKVGTPVDHFMLLCFHYDASSGKYSATVMRLLRLGGVLTVAAIVLFWLASAWRGRRNARRHAVAG